MRERRGGRLAPIVVAEGLTWEQVAAIRAHQSDYPELSVIRQEVGAATELLDQGCRTLLIDLDGTRIINSIGVSILLEIMEKLLEDKGQLAFCNLTPTIEKTFHIMGLAQYAGVYSDEETAIAELSPESAG